MIIVALIVIVCLSFIVIAHTYNGTYKNHYTMFNVWWGSLVLISYLNLSPLNQPSLYTYIIILLGTIGFNISVFTSKVKMSNIKVELGGFRINVTLLVIFQLIAIFFIFPYFTVGLAADDPASVKATLLDTFTGNPIEVIKIYWFSEPVIITSIILSGFLFYFERGAAVWLVLILTIINVLVFSVAFGGRIEMFRMCFILLTFSYLKGFVLADKELVKKRIKFSFLFIVAFIIIMTLVTQKRSFDNDVSFYKTFNIYFIGSFSLFDNFLNNPHISMIGRDLLFGRATFASFIDPFLLFGSKVLHINDLTTKDMGVNIINDVQEKFYSVGKEGYQMNAFATMYYPFIRDYGMIGVLAIPFLLGYILNKLVYLLFKFNSLYIFLIYVLLCYIMIFASNRWEFVNFWPFGAIAYLYILTNKSRSNVYLDSNI